VGRLLRELRLYEGWPGVSWAKFDDRYHDNRKVKRAWKLHRGTVGLHAMAVTYCAMHETDGIVDAEWLEEKLPMKKERDTIIAALVQVGLFTSTGDGGVEVNDFLEYNRSKAASEAERDRKATRQQKWRERSRSTSTRRDVDASVDASTGRHGDSAPTRPDPTRPIPPSPPRGNRARERVTFENTAQAWVEGTGVTGDPAALLRAYRQAGAWKHQDPVGHFRGFCRQHFNTLTVTEEPVANVHPLTERAAS
jgi:hypothetical protein